MTACPKCGIQHRGPRDLSLLLAEQSRVIANALDHEPEQAASYLRVQWLCGSLELFGYCANCLGADAAAQIALAQGRPLDVTVTPAPAMHLCVVIPFRGAK